ncbi:hypothetical protein C8R46DRAFT_1205805 [Mycena filopes]|nr:hypothetical protein C8R46DRAFT_1205805 [Mycena filopes]
MASRLPAELLLMVIDHLSETSPDSIRSLSLTNRWLRELCLRPLFSTIQIRDVKEIVALESRATDDPEFARLIRKLVLPQTESPGTLQTLLPRLPALKRLDMDARALDVDILTTINAHRSLETVAISDEHLGALSSLLSTHLPFSKILVHLAIMDRRSPQSPELHSVTSRGLRLTRLRLNVTLRISPEAFSFPGLEEIEIRVDPQPRYPMSWLQGFVERHGCLKSVRFGGSADSSGSTWAGNPDIRFGQRFIDAVEREGLHRKLALTGFTTTCSQSGAFVEDWPVTQVDISIFKAVGASVLRMVGLLAPQLSVLTLSMPRFGRHPLAIEDLVSPLTFFPSLRRLELHGVYTHLSWDGEAPWELPPSTTGEQISGCLHAHAAFRWLITRAAHLAPSLENVYITDEGDDREGLWVYPWKLKVLYDVSTNHDLEVVGTPVLFIAPRYGVKKAKIV